MKIPFLIWILLIFFSSCKETEKERITRLVTEWQGREILFPEDIVFTRYVTDTVDWQIPESDYKILIYVDSIGCVNCKLQLDKWKEFINKVDMVSRGNVPFLFIFHPKNLIDLRYLLLGYNFNTPVFVDLKNTINNMNNFSDHTLFQTFLLDKNNKVLIIGNPINNLAIKDLYLKQIAGTTPSISNQPAQTTAEALQTEINFGSFYHSEKKIALFEIRNTGQQPLVIVDAATTCGCATLTFDKHPAIPNDILQVKVTYSPKAKESGFFSETITIKCNTEAWIKLNIKGQVL